LDYLNNNSKSASSTSEADESLLCVLDRDKVSDADSSGDIFQLSPAAQLAVNEAETALTSSDTLKSLQLSADAALVSLKKDIAAAFEANGIDTTQEIDLAINSNGDVVVTNDNPQKARIEQLFKSDPDLKKAFEAWAQTSQTAGSAQESKIFQTAYDKNAPLALHEYSYLFDNSSEATVSLSLKGESSQTLYNRSGQAPIVVAKIGG
jgi:hypothetical protein